MKKVKLFGISVALLGCAASVGTALALYQKGFGDGNPNGFGFGGFKYSPSSGAFKFLSTLNTGGSTGWEVESGNAALSPEHNTVKYSFKIAAAYGSESAGLVKQDAILGKLSITKEGDLKNYISVSAYVDGYTRYDDKDNYWTTNASLSVRTLGGEGDTISAYIPAPTSVSTSMSDAIEHNKYLVVHVTLTLTATDEQFMNMDEGQYSIGVAYTDIDDGYGRPYIVGDGTDWKVEDEYAMVPNLAASTYEFCFKDLNSDSAHTFSALKILKNKVGKDTADIWNTDKWDIYGSYGKNVTDDPDVSVNPATVYFVTAKNGNENGYAAHDNNIYQND